MLTRYSDYRRPTDAAFAFPLKPVTPRPPAVGAVSDIRQVAAEVFEAAVAERFEKNVERWSGPEDVVDGAQPWAGCQRAFEVVAPRRRLTRADLHAMLRGVVQVSCAPTGQTDYLLRDHHLIDVALYHYRSTGALPRALLHVDRHSDWCKDSYLEQRRPAQAATWWKLFEGLKRPDDGAPVLGDGAVQFVTGRAPPRKGRDVPGSVLVPHPLLGRNLSWESVLAQPEALAADWVSLDLDYFQPAAQLRLASGLLRDPRFHRVVRQAAVRVFVLSPQFTGGGDKVDPWVVQGGLESSLRLLNLLRQGA